MKALSVSTLALTLMQSMSNLKLVRKDNKISSANNEILQNVKKLFFRSKFIIVGLNGWFYFVNIYWLENIEAYN